MLNEHYDVTTAAYAVGYESYPISVGNIRGCLESHPREIVRSSRLAKAGDLSSAVGFNIKLNYRVDIYLNDEFMTSRDITFIADDNNAELIPCLSTDLLVSLGIKK